MAAGAVRGGRGRRLRLRPLARVASPRPRGGARARRPAIDGRGAGGRAAGDRATFGPEPGAGARDARPPGDPPGPDVAPQRRAAASEPGAGLVLEAISERDGKPSPSSTAASSTRATASKASRSCIGVDEVESKCRGRRTPVSMASPAARAGRPPPRPSSSTSTSPASFRALPRAAGAATPRLGGDTSTCAIVAATPRARGRAQRGRWFRCLALLARRVLTRPAGWWRRGPTCRAVATLLPAYPHLRPRGRPEAALPALNDRHALHAAVAAPCGPGGRR